MKAVEFDCHTFVALCFAVLIAHLWEWSGREGYRQALS